MLIERVALRSVTYKLSCQKEVVSIPWSSNNSRVATD